MAKRNSTKTATKEAMQASEPRLQAITGWKGINLSEAPANWGHEDNSNSQTDLAPNFLLVQNNVESTDLGALEVRPKDSVLFDVPDDAGFELTGVSYIKGRWLYLVVKDEANEYGIIAHDVTDDNASSYAEIRLSYHYKHSSAVMTRSGTRLPCKFTCIYSYLNDEKEHLVVLGKMTTGDLACITFTGPLETVFSETGGVENSVEVDTPSTRPVLVAKEIMPNEAAVDFWETMLGWATFIKTTSGIGYQTSYFKGYTHGGTVRRTDLSSRGMMIVEADKWYLDEYGDMYLKDSKRPELTSLLRFSYTQNAGFAEAESTSSYFYSHWRRLLFKDKMTFDRVWVYKQYDSASRVPSSVSAPNEWKIDPTNVNLTQPTLITKWGNSPSYRGSVGAITDPDTQYEEAYRAMQAGFNNDYVRYGIAKNGDLWLLVNLVRGASGANVFLMQANAPAVDSVDPEAPGVTDINILYAYANRFGQTTISSGPKVLSFSPSIGPVNWSASAYATIGFYGVPKDQDIERINVYCTMDESESPIFIGYVNVDPDDVKDYYSFDWYGSSADTDEWSDANMKPDPENTTRGPDAEYCHMHDGRLYFWGSETRPYRLTIGGNPGHELNISRGHGGAYIDIEPGIGTVVHGTYKWKTTSGASIVTILCGNENTSTHKRFNLVENNITVDNELSEKSYMVEEISNTVGCQSNWGAGVWADGFYVLNRYGLTLTTMAMEYNSQIQSQLISDAVQPIFTDKLATLMDNARMVYADKVVYVVFGTEGDEESLDRLILCYDVTLKAWYTFTYGDQDTDLRHLMNIDYKGAWEGLGLICPDHVGFIPTTGSQDYVQENMVPFLIETGELSTTRPTQQTSYIAQLEFRFDYFIGDMDIDLEGVDYYGRRVHVHKHVHTHEVVNDLVDWMRVNCRMENYHIVMKGTARFRLTHFIAKVYQESKKVGLMRGYDALETYKSRRGGTAKIHHYIRNYANLRETILP